MAEAEHVIDIVKAQIAKLLASEQQSNYHVFTCVATGETTAVLKRTGADNAFNDYEELWLVTITAEKI